LVGRSRLTRKGRREGLPGGRVASVAELANMLRSVVTGRSLAVVECRLVGVSLGL
jgi:hypothetical protein